MADKKKKPQGLIGKISVSAEGLSGLKIATDEDIDEMFKEKGLLRKGIPINDD